jgi:hypothetical protein
MKIHKTVNFYATDTVCRLLGVFYILIYRKPKAATGRHHNNNNIAHVPDSFVPPSVTRYI